MKAIKTLWYWLTRYMVCVKWGDDWERVHWERTADAARETIAAYPADAVVMVGKRGKLLAARW